MRLADSAGRPSFRKSSAQAKTSTSKPADSNNIFSELRTDSSSSTIAINGYLPRSVAIIQTFFHAMIQRDPAQSQSTRLQRRKLYHFGNRRLAFVGEREFIGHSHQIRD